MFPSPQPDMDGGAAAGSATVAWLEEGKAQTPEGSTKLELVA